MKDDRTIYITSFDLERLTRVIEFHKPKSAFDQENLDCLINDLDRATVVEPKEIPPNVVTMNSRLYLRDIDSGEEMMLTLVFPADADVSQCKVSILAPVGAAVIGYRTGDIIEWKIPSGVKRLTIENIAYQPEAAGNFNL